MNKPIMVRRMARATTKQLIVIIAMRSALTTSLEGTRDGRFFGPYPEPPDSSDSTGLGGEEVCRQCIVVVDILGD